MPFHTHLRAFTLVGALAFVALVPASLAAQYCVGSPLSPGEVGVQGTVSFADGATGYGAAVGTNLAGPLAIRGSFGILDVDNVDTNLKELAAGAAYELGVEGVSLCPVFGVGYGWWGDRFAGIDADISIISIPVGFAVGGRVGEAGSTYLIPHAEGGILYDRVRMDLSMGSDRFTETDSETEFYVRGGATLVFGQMFFTGGVSKTTREESKAVVSLSLGVRF